MSKGVVKFEVQSQSLNGGTYSVHAALLENKLVSVVNAGENKGATLKHDHVVLTLDDGTVVRFNDPRRFGSLDYMVRGTEAAHPLLAGLGLIGAALAVPHLAMAPDSTFPMLIFNAPPLLLALGVCMKELPHLEFPRLPRRSSAQARRQACPTAPS